jgi:hypothetical protein
MEVNMCFESLSFICLYDIKTVICNPGSDLPDDIVGYSVNLANDIILKRDADGILLFFTNKHRVRMTYTGKCSMKTKPVKNDAERNWIRHIILSDGPAERKI